VTWRAIGAACALALTIGGCGGASSGPASTATIHPAPVTRPGDLPVAPVYASRNGELHIRVVARQVTSTIAGARYHGINTYATSIVDGHGSYTPGTTSAYVGPQWSVQSGDRLVIDYVNALPDIPFLPVGSTTPEMIPQPINLHTHGLTVSPAGNSDNVLLSIPPGRSNRYTINIPDKQFHGLYWYHPHIHGITDDQVYSGLAGHIVVGRLDGDYRELNGLAMDPMMIRYNVRRAGPKGELIDASPSNAKGTALRPRGQMIYTLNGAVAPRIKLNAADPAHGTPPESQVWAFTNITGSASYILALEEVDRADAKNPSVRGRPLDFTVVSIDGTPMPRPIVKTGTAARRGYLLGQGGRVAILVQGPSDPSKVVRLMQVQNRSGTGGASAFNFPKGSPTAGWRDYTRDVLAVSYTDRSRPGKHVDTPARLTTNYHAHLQHLERERPTHRRTFLYNAVAPGTKATPNNFPVNFSLFPNNRLDQPKVGTVEEWTILNESSLHHPFHVHSQYAQVMKIVAPVNRRYRDPKGAYPSLQYVTDMAEPHPATHIQDIINVPPALVGKDGMPVMDRHGRAAHPGKVVLRVRIDDYLGTYVEHCHRLPHEDRGMMSMVRAIPHDPVFATSGGPGGATVTIRRAGDLGKVATLTPFPGGTGPSATAVGDMDGDTVPDVAIASGRGLPTAVRVYSGASGYRKVVRAVTPFGTATTGATVAFGDINADGHDELIVGQAAGGPPRVRVFDAIGGTPLADFNAYEPGFRGGVSVAAGTVEEGGRVSLITGAGRGRRPTVNMYNFDLFGDAEGRMPDLHAPLKPLRVIAFDAAPPTYRGGISVATGYPFAAEGKFADVLATTLSGRARMGIYELAPHDHMVDVSPSGVMRPHEYQPDAPRMATERQTVDLGVVKNLGAGAVAGAVSTLDGAQIIVAPRAGGQLSLWGIAKGPLKVSRLRSLPVKGSRVSGI
jgi:FtsP/CotA-like multicopper oxidase with cupredoxin domain